MFDGDELLTESFYTIFVIDPKHEKRAAVDQMRPILAGKILDALDDLGLLDI